MPLATQTPTEGISLRQPHSVVHYTWLEIELVAPTGTVYFKHALCIVSNQLLVWISISTKSQENTVFTLHENE